MKCPRCQQDNPPRARFCLECGTPCGQVDRHGRPTPSYTDLQQTLSEALAQQTATSEILHVISGLPTDAQPVLETIAERAARLCSAYDAAVYLRHGERLQLVAHHGPVPVSPRARDMLLSAGSVAGRAVLEGRAVHVDDLSEAAEFPYGRDLAREVGYRTVLVVPLLREGAGVGAVGIRRLDVQPFTAKQITLLETFAAQAVIAIENVRLFTELQDKNRALTAAHAEVAEALDRQTATSGILRAISQSQTDVGPVFEAIVDSAVRLLRAYTGALTRVVGEQIVLEAFTRTDAAGDTALQARFPVSLESDSSHALAIRDRSPLNVVDAERDPRLSVWAHQYARVRGYRSQLVVPMLRQADAIGTISVSRREPGGFEADEIALIQTFADQAVIAIENVRLFTELHEKNRGLREALERQTATGEILRVIAASPTEIQPVLDTIAESAARVCGANDAVIYRTEQGDVTRIVGGYGPIPKRRIGEQGRNLVRSSIPGRAMLERRTVHVHDIQSEEGDEFPFSRELQRRLGSQIRTSLATPLLREGVSIGAILIRRVEVQPFTDTQIELLQTFADQAVIAIENVRLFTELQDRNRDLTDALERQTVTGEILRVISSSPTDTQPVFDTIAANAARLCAARDAQVLRVEGDVLRLVAAYGSPSMPSIRPVTRGHAVGRAVIDRQPIHVRDMGEAVREFPETSAPQHGVQSVIAVPLVRQDVAVGVIRVSRTQIEPFTDAQIGLLQTFADQAVIAIENVRLFSELREKNRALTEAHEQVTRALEQQTATSEILRTIAQAHTDVQPVFDAIVGNAARLCDADDVRLMLVAGDMLRHAAGIGPLWRQVPADLEIAITRSLVAGRAVVDRRVVHVWDLLAEPEEEFAVGRELARRFGHRTIVAVPLLRDGAPVGVVTVGRGEVRPFTESQVELLRTFADQAVIAIENARLFKELEARTADLARSVDQLTALGEVGRAVSSSLDVETVLTTIVSRAVELSGLDGGVVFEYDEAARQFVQRAQAGTGGALAAARRATRIREGEGVVGQTALTRQPVQVADIIPSGAYVGPNRQNLIDAGVRAILAVPMVREGQLIGCLGVTRNEPGEFPTETIELLRTFATQSALAIQNARLFHEIENKSRQLEVASRHKSEFLASMSHELRTPLNAILGFNEMILGDIYGEVPADLREPLMEMQNSGRHLLRLINNVLDLSKIEAGRMELVLGDYSVADTVAQVRASLHPLAADKGLEFVTAVPVDLPLAHGDAGRITQCLVNLAGNAIKFTRQGRVEIAVDLQGELLVYRVTDTGIGIGREMVGTLFAEFRQADPTIASEFGGTGLGLSITRKFTEMHGGRVWVESEPGQGSTFFLALPLRVDRGATR